MAQRLTFDFVKEQFEKQGCILLENTYQNAHTKMNYRCSCGNTAQINYLNFREGKRCGCGNVRRGKERRTDFETIKKVFEEGGCELLDDCYQGSHVKLRYRCSCGVVHSADINHFRAGQRCPNCRYRKTRQAMALTYEEVKQYFQDQGCELLETEYHNARTKMRYRCVCGRLSEIVYDSFKKGNRCRECGNEKISQFLTSDRWRGSNNPRWIEDREIKRRNDLFGDKCRNMVRRSFSYIFNKKKDERTEAVLGYTFKELIEHVESHPNWDSVKDQDWDLDHIFPLKAFTDYNVLDITLANCLENLQPMLRIDNQKKNASYDKDAFEEWLLTKGIQVTQPPNRKEA